MTGHKMFQKIKPQQWKIYSNVAGKTEPNDLESIFYFAQLTGRNLINDR